MPEQKPSIGRMVHYRSLDTRHYAAVVTQVHEASSPQVNAGLVDLYVFFDREPGSMKSVPHDENCSGASWHWPERVE